MNFIAILAAQGILGSEVWGLYINADVVCRIFLVHRLCKLTFISHVIHYCDIKCCSRQKYREGNQTALLLQLPCFVPSATLQTNTYSISKSVLSFRPQNLLSPVKILFLIHHATIYFSVAFSMITLFIGPNRPTVGQSPLLEYRQDFPKPANQRRCRSWVPSQTT